MPPHHLRAAGRGGAVRRRPLAQAYGGWRGGAGRSLTSPGGSGPAGAPRWARRLTCSRSGSGDPFAGDRIRHGHRADLEERAAPADLELVDDALPSGLHIEEAPVGRDGGIDRTGIGGRVGEQGQCVPRLERDRAERRAAGVRRVERRAVLDDPAGCGLCCCDRSELRDGPLRTQRERRDGVGACLGDGQPAERVEDEAERHRSRLAVDDRRCGQHAGRPTA